jgi:hypothetical protein
MFPSEYKKNSVTKSVNFKHSDIKKKNKKLSLKVCWDDGKSRTQDFIFLSTNKNGK